MNYALSFLPILDCFVATLAMTGVYDALCFDGEYGALLYSAFLSLLDCFADARNDGSVSARNDGK